MTFCLCSDVKNSHLKSVQLFYKHPVYRGLTSSSAHVSSYFPGTSKWMSSKKLQVLLPSIHCCPHGPRQRSCPWDVTQCQTLTAVTITDNQCILSWDTNPLHIPAHYALISLLTLNFHRRLVPQWPLHRRLVPPVVLPPTPSSPVALPPTLSSPSGPSTDA